MFLISVIPLTFVPRQEAQIFTYFFSRPLERGTIAEAPIGNRTAPVLVLGSEDVQERKAELRSASFKLKGISGVLNERRVASEDDISFFEWLANYYFSPVGFVARAALPAYLQKHKDLDYESVAQYRGDGFSFAHTQSPLRFAEYVKIIEHHLPRGQQTLLLFPETLEAERFFERLPSVLQKSAVLWASQRTPKQEYVARTQLLTGETKTVVGTRGAALLQLPWLGAVVVEGEENDSHKSWDQHPKYDARTVALWRTKTHNISLLMGSETPSVMLYARAQKEGVKVAFKKPHTRSTLSGQVQEVRTHVVDLREEMQKGNTSPLSVRLQKELSQVKNGTQAVLLINRRGAYTVVLCRDCGHTLRCNRCDAAMVTFTHKEQLVCRFCGSRHSMPKACPSCGGSKFKALGSGTQRVVDEIRAQHPHLQAEVMDSDHTPSPQAQRAVLERFKNKDIDVLVGTQMVVKPRIIGGVHVTGIVNLEASLLLPEYNGEEQTFLLASKLRSMAANTFIWQTYQPEHPVISHVVDETYEQFLKDTLARREQFGWPPASQLIMLTLRERDQKEAERKAHVLGKKLLKVVPKGMNVYDPLPAHTSKVKGRYVWEMLIRADKRVPITVRNTFLSYVPSTWEVDVDPIGTIN